MTGLVLVDSNVLVYAHDARDAAKHARAAEWIAALWRNRTGRVSVQVLSECYHTLTRKLRPGMSSEEAWDEVKVFVAWRPQPVDVDVLERGREVERRYGLNWWDCLVVAAAQAQGCVILLSEDLQDGAAYGGVTVRNPFTLHVGEAAAAYPAIPASASRHPPRGRPRR
jgi:predicted nucleic acid-binding protein